MHVGDRWIEVDCVWEAQRLMVELDGRRAHLNAHAFESDRYRDLELQAAGWTVVRITWRQLRDSPDQIAQLVYSLLFRS
jgi:very-short-patch-repair endonuclease